MKPNGSSARWADEGFLRPVCCWAIAQGQSYGSIDPSQVTKIEGVVEDPELRAIVETIPNEADKWKIISALLVSQEKKKRLKKKTKIDPRRVSTWEAYAADDDFVERVLTKAEHRFQPAEDASTKASGAAHEARVTLRYMEQLLEFFRMEGIPELLHQMVMRLEGLRLYRDSEFCFPPLAKWEELTRGLSLKELTNERRESLQQTFNSLVAKEKERKEAEKRVAQKAKYPGNDMRPRPKWRR
eukprot:TRINITY_DN2116_c0_g4_i1.p3 TRINITY_DN2116_c0_g4~~TRINITY_DN2116_c0_g4_i1.p3  ORF type:complete len:242 (-),score=12.07 TRINITY_DN2116_c0_g4_i1:3040-3765(-)